MEKFVSKSHSIKDNNYSKTITNNLSTCLDDDDKETITQLNSYQNKPTLEMSTKLHDIFASFKNNLEKYDNFKKVDGIVLRTELMQKSLESKINSLKMDCSKVNETIKGEITAYNTKIDELINDIDTLKKAIYELNQFMTKKVGNAKRHIDNFLKISGIPYTVEISVKSNSMCKTILKAKVKEGTIEVNNPKYNLSYGEKNAIALILFSLTCTNDNELVILDDPISSFDINKKYAILYYLFNEECNGNSFKNKTVLMLTHDFSTVINYIKLNKINSNANANLIVNVNGILKEKEITSENIMNIIKLEKKNSKTSDLNIITRLVHLRRYFELTDDLTNHEYDILSSLLHLREKPSTKIGRDEYEVIEDCTDSLKNICNYINDFNYEQILAKLSDKSYLLNEYNKVRNNVEKFYIIRILINSDEVNCDDRVLWDFLCEHYHIENELLYGLDGLDYDLLPGYIFDICDNLIKKIK